MKGKKFLSLRDRSGTHRRSKSSEPGQKVSFIPKELKMVLLKVRLHGDNHTNPTSLNLEPTAFSRSIQVPFQERSSTDRRGNKGEGDGQGTPSAALQHCTSLTIP